MRLRKKPWEYRICAVIPHLDTPETLPLAVRLLRLQSERPYITIVDTGSTDEALAQVRAMRAPDLEVQCIDGHAFPHSSDRVCHAMDLAFSMCRSPLLFATHADCFLRRRDFLAELAARCDAGTPGVGYRMSPRAGTDAWRSCLGHVASMFHMPTMHRIGATWGIQRAHDQFGWPRRQGGWPDTETAVNLVMQAAGATALFVGDETNGERQVTADFDHCRSYPSLKRYAPRSEHHATQKTWIADAMAEAAARADQWEAVAPMQEPPEPPRHGASLVVRQVDCRHYADGRCAIGKLGGRPTPGACMSGRCTDRLPLPEADRAKLPPAPAPPAKRAVAAVMSDKKCSDCGKPPEASPAPAGSPADSLSGSLAERGPRLWDLLHSAVGELAQSHALAEIDGQLGCGDCRQHLREYVAAHPPDGTPSWGWRFQNAVNRRLGRPEVPYDVAAKLRGWDRFNPAG